MLNICFLSIIMIFSVIGIYFLIREILTVIFRNNVQSCVVLEVKDKTNELEYTLRSVLTANPNSEVVILNKCKNEEINKILNKFSDDNSRIHIKTAPEK